MISRRAQWIWSDEGVDRLHDSDHMSPYRVRMFRFTFRLPPRARGTVSVSADTWYELFCNGVRVGDGPAKGDVAHHFYDSHDLSPYLRAQENVLAARVVDVSPVESNPATLGAPTSYMHYSGGFMLQGTIVAPASSGTDDDGNTPDVNIRVDTNSQWRVAVDRAYAFHNEQQLHGGFVGLFEELHAQRIPPGWNDRGFHEDDSWKSARELYPAISFDDRRDDETPYGLLPRTIPTLPKEGPFGFADVFQVDGTVDAETWKRVAGLDSSASQIRARFEPGSSASIVLDAGTLTTGFPVITTKGGSGATIRITYAEALRLSWDTPNASMLGERQSHANLSSGYTDEDHGWTYDPRGRVEGFCDIYHPPRHGYEYRPMRFRTFRFIKLELTAGDEPLTVECVRYLFTAYPFSVVADFSSSDELPLNTYWQTSIRTFRLCCHETFEDCPYYEQMQYAGDSAITSQLALWTSADSRLSAQPIRHFDWSRVPEGTTQSRYPSSIPQFIPSWSLHWIMMVWDYYQLTGDARLVRETIPGMRAVLDWFRFHADQSTLPSRLPYWNNVDWSPEWDRGQPPGWDEGASSVICGQFICALEKYLELLVATQASTEFSLPLVYRRRVESEILAIPDEIQQLRVAALATFWDPESGHVHDASTRSSKSQYSDAWALLAGYLPANAQDRLLGDFPNGSSLAPASFFGLYWVVEALRKVQRYSGALKVYDGWREMADFGLSTWAEETTYWRSLCHAWSAHPAVFFIRTLLGASPDGPGFQGILLEPKTCGLAQAAGQVATPSGPVSIEWRVETDCMYVSVGGPSDLQITLVLPQDHGGVATHERICGQGKIETRVPFKDKSA